MSQRKTALRHNFIITKLKGKKRATFAEINEYLKFESEMQGEDLTISKRTFVRDIAEIAEIYNVFIRYDFSAGNYFIENETFENETNRRLDALGVFHFLKFKEYNKDHVFLDNRQASGSEHLFGLLHAINNNFQITFDYQSFYYEDAVERTVIPLAIKEFKYRWYLFAQSTHNDKIKCYGLDRISDLEISKKVFKVKNTFNLVEQLRYCFGIISPNAETPSKVVLSFDPFQGKYIKSLPLHHSQKILIDNEEELQISLQVFLTFDFIQELLSFGSAVKVIQPQELIDKLQANYKNALNQY